MFLVLSILDTQYFTVWTYEELHVKNCTLGYSRAKGKRFKDTVKWFCHIDVDHCTAVGEVGQPYYGLQVPEPNGTHKPVVPTQLQIRDQVLL